MPKKRTHSLYEPVHEIGTYRISTKASNNPLFGRVQRNLMHKSCLESSSTFILCICELQKLWQGHENAQACWSLPHMLM